MAENPADIKSNDYLAALVRKISQLKEVPKNILHADEVHKMQGDPAAVVRQNSVRPDLVLVTMLQALAQTADSSIGWSFGEGQGSQHALTTKHANCSPIFGS